MILSTWLCIFEKLQVLPSKLIGCHCFSGTWRDLECITTDLYEPTSSSFKVYMDLCACNYKVENPVEYPFEVLLTTINLSRWKKLPTLMIEP